MIPGHIPSSCVSSLYPHNVLGLVPIATSFVSSFKHDLPALRTDAAQRQGDFIPGILLASHSLPLLVPSSWTGCLCCPPSTCLPQALGTCLFFFFSFLIPFPQTAMIHLFLNNSGCIFCEAFPGRPGINTCPPSSLYFPVFPARACSLLDFVFLGGCFLLHKGW